MVYILGAVGLLQLFFLYLEFQGGVPAGTFKACSDGGEHCAQRIPNIIHQTYKTERVPDRWNSTPSQWKEYHPGWTYMLWTDEDNEALIRDHYPDFLETYLSYPYGIQRSDAARYFILHKYGGVYADLDIQPRRHVSEIIGDAELVLPQTPNFGLTNAFMASVNGSAFFSHIINLLPEHANKWYQITRHWKIMTSTGPTFIWAQYDKWKGDKSAALIVPAAYWGKCSICKSACREIATSPLKHLTGNSWFSLDSFVFNYVIMCNPVPLAVFVLFIVDLYRTGRLWSRWFPQKVKDDDDKEAIPRDERNKFIKTWSCLFLLAYALYYLKKLP